MQIKLLYSTQTKNKIKSYANKYNILNTHQERKKIRMQIKLLCSTHTKKERKAYALKGWWQSKFMCRIKPKGEDITENKGTKR